MKNCGNVYIKFLCKDGPEIRNYIKEKKNTISYLFFMYRHIYMKLNRIRLLRFNVSGFKLTSSTTLKTSTSLYFLKRLRRDKSGWRRRRRRMGVKKLSALSQIQTLNCSASLTLSGFAGSMFSSAVLLSISATWLMNRERGPVEGQTLHLVALQWSAHSAWLNASS